VIFQPHRYTRTRDFMDEFAQAFQGADTLFLLDIYAAGEQPLEGVTGETLVGRIQASGRQDVRYMSSFAEAAESAAASAGDGDMILMLGAGNVFQLGPMIMEALQAREAAGGTELAVASPNIAASSK